MPSDFMQGLGKHLGDERLIVLLAPSLLAWLTFAGALWYGTSGTEQMVKVLTRFDWEAPELLAVLVGILLLAAVSGFLVQRFDFIAIRLAEGYWPQWNWLQRIRRSLGEGVNRRTGKMEERFQLLVAKNPANLSPEESREYVNLDRRLMRTPSSPGARMPTQLGNTLRASELRPRDKYGLETIVCWPRLWLLLPEGAKKDIGEARAALDGAAYFATWGVILFIFGVGAGASLATLAVMCKWCPSLSCGASIAKASLPPIVVGLLTVFGSYRSMISAAEGYGDLIEAVFDIHRVSLYQSLRWPLPANPAEERIRGEELTAYLWRGANQFDPTFVEEVPNQPKA